MTLEQDRDSEYPGVSPKEYLGVDQNIAHLAALQAVQSLPDIPLSQLADTVTAADLLKGERHKKLNAMQQHFIRNEVRFRAAGMLASGEFSAELFEEDISRIIENQQKVVADPAELRAYLEAYEQGKDISTLPLGQRGFHFGAHSVDLLRKVHEYGYIFLAEIVKKQGRERHLISSIYGLHEMPLQGSNPRYGNSKTVQINDTTVDLRNLDVVNVGRKDKVLELQDDVRRHYLCQWRTTVRPDIPDTIRDEFGIESFRRLGIGLLMKYMVAQYGEILSTECKKDDENFPVKTDMILNVGEVDWRGMASIGGAINFASREKNMQIMETLTDAVRTYFHEVDEPDLPEAEKKMVLQLRVFSGKLRTIIEKIEDPNSAVSKKYGDTTDLLEKVKKSARQRATYVRNKDGKSRYKAIW